MDADKENFKTKMRKALGTNSSQEIDVVKVADLRGEVTKPTMRPASGASVEIDLPLKRQRKSGYLSCRCTRQTEDAILALMQTTGLSQSEIVNHLIEISLPVLAEKYLGSKPLETGR